MNKLAVFDFDSTIIDGDSGDFMETDEFNLPHHLEELYTQFNWPTRMNAALDLINKKFSFNSDKVLERLRQTRISDSLSNLIRKLKNHNFILLIVSDGNSLFVETILAENNLLDYFDHIITNKASVNNQGLIQITPYFDQIKSLRPCDLCVKLCGKPSICKQAILIDYINNNNNIEKIFFIADGENDNCAVLCLDENSYSFAKRNLALHKLIEQNSKEIKSKVIYWDNANDISSYLD